MRLSSFILASIVLLVSGCGGVNEFYKNAHPAEMLSFAQTEFSHEQCANNNGDFRNESNQFYEKVKIFLMPQSRVENPLVEKGNKELKTKYENAFRKLSSSKKVEFCASYAKDVAKYVAEPYRSSNKIVLMDGYFYASEDPKYQAKEQARQGAALASTILISTTLSTAIRSQRQAPSTTKCISHVRLRDFSRSNSSAIGKEYQSILACP